MAQHQHVTHPIVLRRLEVKEVVDLNPRMRRVTLTGHELAGFERDGLDLPALVSTGFDDHVKLVLAEGGDIESALPVQRAQSIDWPEAPHRRMRDYTPSRWDPVARELDLDFVRHGDGPAATWAEKAQVGDALHIAGPKASVVLPEGIDWVLLAGDETAIPSVVRFLAERPTESPVQVVLEVRHPEAVQELDLRERDTVRWSVIGEHAPSALSTAVTAVDWWPGSVYAWAAGEGRSLLPLRRWLARDRGVPKSHQNVTGYWTEQPAAVSTAEVSGPAPTDPHVLLSPVPWFASRAALSLGLLDAVADAPRPVGALADALGIADQAIEALVDYLVVIEVLLRDGEAVRLGPVGELVLDEDELRGEHDDGLEGRALAALAELGPAVGAGQSAYARHHGRSLWADLQDDRELFADQLGEARGFPFVVRGLPALASWQGARAVTVTGIGAPTLVATEGLADVRFTVVEPPVPAAVLREEIASAEVRVEHGFERSDLVVAALALRYRTDDEVRALLAQAAASADRLLVVEELTDPTVVPTDHEAEHLLLRLSGTGSPSRTPERIVALAGDSGWDLVRHTSLGWTFEAFELTRTGA
ncbi:siderophore-interacting protein [Oerskovia enterophila]|uniref:siderophore-interacting protein n=1 Tax=Oerskovia enterophila TaxID=43678 RepID=UPI0038047744